MMNNIEISAQGGHSAVLHLAHGTPDFALPGGEPAARWRTLLGRLNLGRYEAVVVVSAHAAEKARAVLAGGMASPPLLHDYRGFNPTLTDLHLETPAAAEELRHRLLAGLGVLGLPVADEPTRPLDHGVWVPLLGAFGSRLPVPVFSLGLPLHDPLGRVRKWGEELGSLPLRVLWISSGGIVHNLSALAWDEPEGTPYGWARDFWEAVETHTAKNALEPLLDPWTLPGGSLAVPTREHYAPFILASGLAGRPLVPLAGGFAYRSLSLEVLAGARLARELRPQAAPSPHPPSL